MTLWPLPDNHDKDNLSAALKHVKNFSVAVDGGAHRGIWTVKLLRCFERVWAFEPHPPHFAKLPSGSTNILGALGEGGKAGLAAGDENDGQYYLNGEGETNILALDSFDLPDCGFLKLDVEGYEYFALRGAEQTIRKFRPVILLEENGLCERYGIKTGSCDELVKGFRYRMVEQVNKDFIYAPR